MKYVVEIDGKSESGKSAIQILKNIAKKGNGITIRKSQLADIGEDAKMIKRMLRARKNGFVNTEAFLSKLKSGL